MPHSIIETLVKKPDNGLRLDAYLAHKFKYFSRTQWQKKIKRGVILIDGKTAYKSCPVTYGNLISYIQSSYVEPQVNPWYSIIYEDEFIMVVNKSGNLPVHPSGLYRKNTLIYILRNDFPLKKLFLANRLDRETSGLIILGKNKDVLAKIFRLFKNREVKKIYYLVVFGRLTPKHLFVDRPIGPNPKSIIRIKHWVDTPYSKPAFTEFSLIKYFGTYSLVKAIPYTGRTNQIRIHISYLGYPIVGDKLYSKDDGDFLEFIEKGWTPRLEKKLLLQRHALHAAKLEFRHPITGKILKLACELPEDMKEFIASVSKKNY